MTILATALVLGVVVDRISRIAASAPECADFGSAASTLACLVLQP